MWDRRWIIFLAAGGALAAAYRHALGDETDGELLVGWGGFLLVWLPAAALIGLSVTYLWPCLRQRWQDWRRNRP